MYNKCEKRKIIRKASTAAAVLIMLLAIGSASAYFTDADSAANHFTVGNISINLEEPDWSEANGKNVTPGQTIPKNPQITNDGANDAYVFVRVAIPTANIKTADKDGSLKAAAPTELFSYDVNSEWILVDKKIVNGTAAYVYAYAGSGDKMKVLAPGSTTQPVFDSVTFANAVEGQFDNSRLTIDVESMGIQADNLGTDIPAEIYGILTAGTSN